MSGAKTGETHERKEGGTIDSAAKSNFTEAFERVVHAVPHEAEFGAVEIVRTTVRPGRETQLTVMLDREGGLDIATCERVAARINAALDAFPDEYTLEVSSAGLSRPLIKIEDYDRFRGRSAKIITTTLVASAKTHRGVLGGTSGQDVILQTGAKNETELPIPFAAIKSANLEYDIRADLTRAKREKQSNKA